MNDDLDVQVLPLGRTDAAVAGWLAHRIERVLGRKPVAHVAVSGGDSAPPVWDHLARSGVSWERVHLWQVDERVAPAGGPDRNATGLLARLVAPAGVPEEHVHLLPVDEPDLAQAAVRYGHELGRWCGGHLDVVHLGLGADGHTASWPPADPALDAATGDVAVVGPFRGVVRLTLTRAAVNRADVRLLHVTGAAKRPALLAFLRGDAAVPASHLRRSGTTVITDQAIPPDLGA